MGLLSILGAVAPIAGKLLGGSTQKTTSTVNYKQMAASAKAAGINKITALRNGGSAGFSSSVSTVSDPSFIGEALGAGLQAYRDEDFRELELQREVLEQDLLRAELEDFQSNSSRIAPERSFGYGIPESEAHHAETVQSPYSRPSSVDPNRVSADAAFATGGVRPVPQRDVYNLYVDVFDSQTGRWVSIPNPDLTDTSPTEALHSLSALGAADYIQNGLQPERSPDIPFDGPYVDSPHQRTFEHVPTFGLPMGDPISRSIPPSSGGYSGGFIPAPTSYPTSYGRRAAR